MSKCPTRQTTKEVSDQTVLDNQTLQELLVRNRHDTRGTGCCKLEVCEVCVGFLKLMIMTEHIKMMQKIYLNI